VTFAKIAAISSRACGHPYAFALACLSVVIWGITGPFFHYSDTWQLVINTGTTVITFLVVFLVQNSQNRDIAALHLKLDELVLAVGGARDEVAGAEDLSDAAIAEMKRSG
jgi:low affinity Fe/Cu permease